MFKVLINYNFTPDKEWIGDDYLIYDRSDDGIQHLNDFDKTKIIRSTNIGNVDYDKLSYLVDNYYELPDVFLWGKTNLFKFITREEYEKVKDNRTFTPLLTGGHTTYRDRNGGLVNYYDQFGMYHEKNDSWYTNVLDCKYCMNFQEFSKRFHIPCPEYLPFAPGGNYILTRGTVHKYGQDFYDEMRQILPHAVNPGEAHMAERCYNLIWS